MTEAGVMAEVIQAVADLARRLDNDEVVSNLARERRKLLAGEFNLAVIGQFKRGKSTLINALIRRPLLPTGVVPLTSVVTSIKFGPVAWAQVIFDSEESRHICVGDLSSYVTETENPHNEKKVVRVEVQVPAKFLRHGITLIDTPGVGSVYSHNTDTTYEFLPELDAIILVLGVDPPVTGTELALIRQFPQDRPPPVLVVLNKIDHLDGPAEVQQAEEFVRKVLERASTNFYRHQYDGVIYRTSARRELEARVSGRKTNRTVGGLARLERSIVELARHQKGQLMAHGAARRIAAAIGRLTFGVTMELRILEEEQDMIDTDVASLERLQSDLDARVDDSRALFDRDINKLAEWVAEETRAARDNMVRQATRHIADVELRYVRNVFLLNERLRTDTLQLVKEEFDAIVRGLHRDVLNRLVRIGERYAEQIQGFAQELQDVYAGIFSVPTQVVAPVDPPQVDWEFSFRLEENTHFFLPKVPVQRVAALLPGSLGRKRVVAYWRQRAERLIDQHAGALQADIRYPLREHARSLKNDIFSRYENLENALAAALERARRKRATASERKRAMDEQRAVLMELHELEQTLGQRS